MNSNKVYLSGFCTEEYTHKKLSIILQKQIKGYSSLYLPQWSYKGYGFITLKNYSSTLKLLEKGEVTIENNTLKVTPYRFRNEGILENDILNKKVFVHNIPNQTRDEDLYELFSQFGSVEEAYVCKRNRNQNFRKSSNKKIGYIVFREEESARNAIDAKELKLKTGKVYICEVNKKKRKKNESNTGSPYVVKETEKEANKRDFFQKIMSYHASRPGDMKYFALKKIHGLKIYTKNQDENLRFNKGD